MTVSIKTLRDADWRQVYYYDGSSLSFVTYACDALPGMTVTHEKRKGFPAAQKAKTSYNVHGRRTNSITQAVRYYNAQGKGADAGRPAPGSVESIGRTRRDAGV